MKNTDHRRISQKCGLVVALIIISLCSSAQQSIPLFADRRDSIGYSELNAAVMGMLRSQRSVATEQERRHLDSLMRLQQSFRSKIIGFKIVYKPNPDFTPLQDLLTGKVKPEEVTKLSLADSPLKALPKEIYSCRNLTELELVNTSIRKLPGRLGRILKLQSIHVYNNVVSGRLRLGRNSTVRSFVIRGVRENNLPASFRHFTSMDSLDLSRNIGVTHFPNVYRNTALKKLNLLENNITLAGLKDGSRLSLEELNLMRNRIKVVPDAMGSFSSLKKLTFNYNEIEDIRPGAGNLKNLESVSFYQNKLTSVPTGVYGMSSLKVIDLYYNQIREISRDISKLNSLRILYLANNQLIALPDNLGELINLRELYLHNNKLSALPESIGNMKELRVLRINNNYFTTFPAPVLTLTNLENLDVSKNYIYRFPVELSGFTKLEILAVLNNPWENQDDVERVSGALQSRGTIVHTK